METVETVVTVETVERVTVERYIQQNRIYDVMLRQVIWRSNR